MIKFDLVSWLYAQDNPYVAANDNDDKAWGV